MRTPFMPRSQQVLLGVLAVITVASVFASGFNP